MKTILLLVLLGICNNFLFGQGTWTISDTGIEAGFKVSDFAATQSGVIYAIGAKETTQIYQSSDHGFFWNLKDSIKLTKYFLPKKDLICAYGDTVLLGATGGDYNDVIYKSADSCKTWMPVREAFSPLYIDDMMVSKSRRIFEVGRVYRCCPTLIYPAIFTFSNSDTLASLISTNSISNYDDNYYYNAICEVGDAWLLSVNNKDHACFVYRSVDQGKTWNLSDTGIGTGYLVKKFAVTANNVVFALAGNNVTTLGRSIFKSTDEGQTWTKLSIGGLSGYNYLVNDICAAGNTIFVSAENENRDYAVLRSDDITSRSELTNSDQVRISPNPSDGTFQIDCRRLTDKPQMIRIFDLTGKLVYQRQCEQKVFEVQSLKSRPGIYMIDVLGEKMSSRNKLIIH